MSRVYEKLFRYIKWGKVNFEEGLKLCGIQPMASLFKGDKV